MSLKFYLNIAFFLVCTPFLQAKLSLDRLEEENLLNPQNPFDREVSDDFKDEAMSEADIEAMLKVLELLAKFDKLEEPKSWTMTESFQVFRPWAMIAITGILAYRLDVLRRLQALR